MYTASNVVSMGAELPDDDGFERALNWILDGIEADLGAHARPETHQTPNRLAKERRLRMSTQIPIHTRRDHRK